MIKTNTIKISHMITGVTSLLLLSITGCATLSKSECQQADWYGIGVNDGSKGRAMSYITNHNEACNKHGISLNTGVWQRGRSHGLKSYCTAVNAYQVGRAGSTLSPVCGFLSTYEQQDIKANYSEGRHIYDFELRLNEYRAEKKRLQAELNETRKLLNEQYYVNKNNKSKIHRTSQKYKQEELCGRRTSSNICTKKLYKKQQKQQKQQKNIQQIKKLSHKISELNLLIQKKEEQKQKHLK